MAQFISIKHIKHLFLNLIIILMVTGCQQGSRVTIIETQDGCFNVWEDSCSYYIPNLSQTNRK